MKSTAEIVSAMFRTSVRVRDVLGLVNAPLLNASQLNDVFSPKISAYQDFAHADSMNAFWPPHAPSSSRQTARGATNGQARA